MGFERNTVKVAFPNHYLAAGTGLTITVGICCWDKGFGDTRTEIRDVDSQCTDYQTVVDPTLRHETDEPTIGLLLVKSKSETIVRYSLESVNKPIGVASWGTQLSVEMSDKWKSALPTIEEIEKEMNADDNAERNLQ